LLYGRGGKLLTQRLDLRKRTVVGRPSPVASDVYCFAAPGHAAFSTSQTGVIVYRTNTSMGRLVLVNRNGVEMRAIEEPRSSSHSNLRFSPDGRQAATSDVSRTTGFGDIWIYDLARGMRERLTDDPGMEVYPVWTPDGRSIVYSSNPGGSLPFLVKHSLAGGGVEQLLPSGKFQIAQSFSPDGATLFFTQLDSQMSGDVFRLNMNALRAQPLFLSKARRVEPEVSPSGKWLALTSLTAEGSEIYLHDLSMPGSRNIRVSPAGGGSARWRRDGQELFYLSADSHAVMAASQRTAGQWNDPTVTELFRGQSDIIAFDVAPDGQSFLISTWTPGAADASLHVIVGAN
jgi:Tol biopolymer transport system component